MTTNTDFKSKEFKNNLQVTLLSSAKIKGINTDVFELLLNKLYFVLDSINNLSLEELVTQVVTLAEIDWKM